MTSPRVAAIVVTFNRKELLVESIAALQRQTTPLSKIFVVDNASTDGTEGYLREKGLLIDLVEYVRLSENTGGAGGFEAGLRHAMKEGFGWYWLMDDDSIAEPQALGELLQTPTVNDEHVGVLSSTVRGVDGQLTEMNVQRYYDFHSTIMHSLDVGLFDGPPFNVDIGSFVGFLVRHEAVEAIGLPIGGFFIYYDDAEYSIRIRRAGLKIVVVPSSVIIHKLKQQIHDDGFAHYWKVYYNQRNYCFTSTRSLRGYDLFYFLARYGKGMTLQALRHLREQHGGVRAMIDIKSVFDGLFGRLGRRVDPTEWRKKYA
jgi:rhamnopyranosyl-N-acetylglucosaminyl-diphospho-decaprenol beta-1,3/1,4-galactofuranosyltransferase